MMATSLPARCAAARTVAARSIWSCAVPWLKFRRTTFTPAKIICSSKRGSLDAGPKVATIFVARRNVMAILLQFIGISFSHGDRDEDVRCAARMERQATDVAAKKKAVT